MGSVVSAGTATTRVADAFVRARRGATPMSSYPGAMPQDLDQAYAHQDEAIGLWDEPIGGWKVGRITGDDAQRLGEDRLSGPIFAPSIVRARGGDAMPIFEDGFAAVEGEVVFVLGRDAPPTQTAWTAQAAAGLIGSVHAGVEVASSPFPGINDHGPLVTISDFGNNRGLLLGEAVRDWRDRTPADWQCETYLDGDLVGAADASGIPGGPVESLRFLLENTARRGLPLKAGMVVSTGAITGVHRARAGQEARVVFAGCAPLTCRLVPLRAA